MRDLLGISSWDIFTNFWEMEEDVNMETEIEEHSVMCGGVGGNMEGGFFLPDRCPEGIEQESAY